MNRKFMVLALTAAAALNLVACGEGTEQESSETEMSIVARQETLTTTSESEENVEDEEQPIALVYDSGIELASINLADTSVTVKSGDSLSDVMSATGLKYIEWSVTYTDVSAINFTGKGYALHDVAWETDLPDDYYPTEIYFQVSDEDGNRVDSPDDDTVQYQIAGIKAEYEEDDPLDYTVTFAGNVQVGMTKEEIEQAMETADEVSDGLYIVDGTVAVYVDYDFDDAIAEEIYAVPATLANIPEE